MENYITLEDLKDFEVWKSWRNGGGLELEPLYSEKEVMNALHIVELKYNRDFTKIYEGMKESFGQLKK
jgi:hypothetical protein